jgi:hypothetical protein
VGRGAGMPLHVEEAVIDEVAGRRLHVR